MKQKQITQVDISADLMSSTLKPFRKAKGDKRLTVVSLFSGAGGLDMGFHMEDYNIVWANDFDVYACETYKANIGDHIRCGDIKKWMYELHQFTDRVDLLIGGPPCQGFSVAGKMNPNDPRSENVWNYVNAIEIVRPKAFVMENVKALGVLEKWCDVRNRLLDRMRGLGYNTDYIVVNSSDYNVPQNRERVLFIGFKDVSQKEINLEKLLAPYKIKAPTVKEVLKSLDKPGVGNNPHVCNAKITFTANPIMRKSPYAGMIFNGLGRPIRVNGYCATLPASMGGNKTPIIDEEELYHNKPSWVEEYHKGLMDGSVKPEFKEAPERLRRLTVEEAAAIQTFPIGYKFVGSRTTMYKQIGNAVPCNMARQIAKMIKKELSSSSDDENEYREGGSMAAVVDFEEATKILLDAKKQRLQPADRVALLIRRVILGTHKTYKYVLVTNLLAKAVQPETNALSLQAGAPISGAFDSRSLCHKVVVPFEREHLANALGGSNEPYLNKPARFTHLSINNAVRDGNDRKILTALIEIARVVNNGGSKTAFRCLSYCFVLLEKVIANNELLNTVQTILTPDLIDIYAYVARYIEESFEGETCAAVVGAVEKQFYSCLRGEYRVEVHKVNECGASSREIGDIDVYEDEKCFYSIEVKDKAFTIYDVEHAFNKMIAAQVRRGSFIYGPRATFDEEQVKIRLFDFEKRKFVTLFMGVLPYVRMVLFQTPSVETSNFVQLLLDTTHEINAKECTIKRVHDLASEMFGKA